MTRQILLILSIALSCPLARAAATDRGRWVPLLSGADRGANNGIGSRAPLEGGAPVVELLDLTTPQQDPQPPGTDNHPPKGFTALFNGRNLTGWKGLVADPPHRARMSPEELAAAQAKADEEMRKHWKAVDGVITYDGKNNNLCTARDYGDFEMLVDWKINPGGDSGIYLRGSPQVQIWDNPLGSGGLYNNQKNPSNPVKKVDNPPGQWNHFHIIMAGDKVTVWLNGDLVTDHVTMENYWERDKPIYPTGQIELQHHGDPLFFKNVFIREIPGAAQAGNGG